MGLENRSLSPKQICLSVGAIMIAAYMEEIIRHWPYREHKKIPAHDFASKLGDIFWTPLIRPVMEYFADGKMTNANDWIDNRPFNPEFADFEGITLLGNPDQIPRRGMFNTVKISLGAWKRKRVLKPINYNGPFLFGFKDLDKYGNPRMKIERWIANREVAILIGNTACQGYLMTPDMKREVKSQIIEESPRGQFRSGILV